MQLLSEPHKEKALWGERLFRSVRVAMVDQFWAHSNSVFKEKLVRLNPQMHLLNSSLDYNFSNILSGGLIFQVHFIVQGTCCALLVIMIILNSEYSQNYCKKKRKIMKYKNS